MDKVIEVVCSRTSICLSWTSLVLLEQRKYEYSANPAPRHLRSHWSTPATAEHRSGEFLNRSVEFTGTWRPGGDSRARSTPLVRASGLAGQRCHPDFNTSAHLI